MKGILRGAYCVALSISIFLCGVILALSCRGITLYKKELLQNGMTVAITLFMAACIVMLCVYGKDKLQTTRRKFSVFMFLLIGLAQIAFLLLVSRPMTIADPARVQNEALAMLNIITVRWIQRILICRIMATIILLPFVFITFINF